MNIASLFLLNIIYILIAANVKFDILDFTFYIKFNFSCRQYIFFPVRLFREEPWESCLDILEVSSPVLFTPPSVDHEVSGVLQPVQDEADQVGLVVDGEQSADVDRPHKHQVAEADSEQGPGHLRVPALYSSPRFQNSKQNRKFSKKSVQVPLTSNVLERMKI